MKGKDLFTNILEARQHINRLKKEADLLESTPQEGVNNNMHQYINEVLYSLNKNQLEIEKKHKEFKQKLPSLNHKREDLQQPLLNGYKKQRRRINSTLKSKREESTKISDNSFSLMVENRQIKMHSYNEKNVKADFTSDRNISNLNIVQENDRSRKSTPISAQFRSRHFDKRSLKAVDILAGSKIGQPQNNSKLGYLQSNNKTYQHQFIIIQGKINRDTPEFASYQRVYDSIMPKIYEQLQRLESQLILQSIQEARLDGKKLAYLCLKDKITQTQLFQCLLNVPLRQKNIKKGKYYGKDGKIKAINKIIAYWKMKNIREKYLTLKKSTIIIQSYFRRQLLRLDLQKKLQKRNEAILQSFQKRQSRFSREFKQIRDQKHIQIHLNSVQMDEQKRLTIDHYPQRQNIQLSRIFRLRDESLIIIYISCSELQPELLNYYYRMMELAGINNYRERLIFITPEVSGRMPHHLSTTKLLYYSANTLNQLKIITSDLPTILYPGQPCNQLLKICDHVGCFLYSGQPQKMKCFSTKSQTKRLLKNLCIQTLPSTMQMYDYGEFLNTFSVLIVKNPQVTIWVLKIDDEANGRGIAYVDIGSSKTIKYLLKKIDYNIQSDTFATQIHNEPQNQQTTIKIRDYLKQHLHQKLQMSTPTVYRNYTEYMGRFIKKGGVIQAHPICFKQQLAAIAITFQLDPDGEYRIITSYQKINGQPFRPLACSFPQKILEHNQTSSVIRQLCDSFRLRKMFGIFTVDFLVNKQQNKHWVLGIDPFLNDYSSSYHLFDLLMMGSYMPERQMYIVDSLTEGNQQDDPQDRLQSRQYIFVPHLHHKNLGKVKIKQFFKAARLEQFNFDVGNKEGVCVMLLDQMTSGIIGLLSVAESRDQTTERLKKMLDFISKISSVKNVDYGRSQLESSADGVSLKDVLSVFTGMVRKGIRHNAKQKAIKKYENSQNLQLLI